MSKHKDLTGQRFGKLLVLKFIGVDKRYNSQWLCKCDCGKEKIVLGRSIKKGDTRSCGCLARENGIKSIKKALEHRKLTLGKLTPLSKTFSRYKMSAKRRNYSFNLSIKEFEQIISKNCYYCNSAPTCLFNIYNGVDRLDNSIGYTVENCVPCCTTCNIAKHEMSCEEFKKWINLVYSNLNNR